MCVDLSPLVPGAPPEYARVPDSCRQIVAPKKANLAQAEAELAETMAILDEKRAQVSSGREMG